MLSRNNQQVEKASLGYEAASDCFKPYLLGNTIIMVSLLGLLDVASKVLDGGPRY